MINLKVGNKKVKLPNQWSELSVKQYAKIVHIINEHHVTEELMEEKTKEENEVNAINSNLECFAYLTNCEKSMLKRCPSYQIEECLEFMLKFLNEVKQKETLEVKPSFKFKNETYYFPTMDFKQTTFGDYIESAQLNMLSGKKDGGRFAVLPEQMAILCKTKEQDEGYNEKLIMKRARLFQELPMNIVWDFVFFLTNATKQLQQNLKTYSKRETEFQTDTLQEIGI
tara:strand:+ start:81 stop:758 length:678 start_codon:yes stop_codon:yes gene_type:complete